MRSATTVVKVGGNEVEDPHWLAQFARAIAELGGSVIVVHGGGKEVSQLQQTLGIAAEWVGGLRVTTPDAMNAVSMVLSGAVNKRIVAALLDVGVQALGLSGEDAGLLEAEPALGGRSCRTGHVHRVSTKVLHTLLNAGYVSVVSPVSRGADGLAMNVNADEAAAEIAVAMAAGRFLMISNVAGYLRESAVLSRIAVDEVESLIASGEATGGMAPKLRFAARACRGGVKEVHIGDLELLRGTQPGTRMTSETMTVSAP